jgi:hypothetical protein
MAAVAATSPDLARGAAGSPQPTPAAQSTASTSDGAAPAAAPHPGFAYQLGQTTLEAARAYWSQNGMKIVGAGHMALGSGRGIDGLGKLSADKVLLVDVAGVDFEGLPTARFGFYEDRLYRIQASLTQLLSNGASAENYTDEQVQALGDRLRAKYGAPSAEHRTLLADASGNDVLIWRLPEGTLTLTTNPLNRSLILSSAKMEADIKAYVKAYCKAINTKTRTSCW